MSEPLLLTSLNHDLRAFFPELRRFSSSKALQASNLYARLKPEIDRVLRSIVQENFGGGVPDARSAIRAVAWNIERGMKLEGIIQVLRDHPVLRESDIFLLSELDYGMARTQNRLVAHEIATALGLNYVFAPSYINLSKGSGLESEVSGKNTRAIHGNAIFSRYPLREPHSIALPNGKDKMKGKEKRLGSQRAVSAIVDHALGPVRVVSVHLDAHSTQNHRHRQMKSILDYLDRLHSALPVLIGGDWNTTTYNARRAVYAIFGFYRRVFMGVRYVINNHYPYPDRWFERRLFSELERRGYRYRKLNQPGGCTLHYDVLNLAQNSNIGDWIPNWCFWFINWALKEHDGRCSFKVDWFAGKGVTPFPPSPPQVVGDLHDTDGPLSDHDAIVLDFLPQERISSKRC